MLGRSGAQHLSTPKSNSTRDDFLKTASKATKIFKLFLYSIGCTGPCRFQVGKGASFQLEICKSSKTFRTLISATPEAIAGQGLKSGGELFVRDSFMKRSKRFWEVPGGSGRFREVRVLSCSRAGQTFWESSNMFKQCRFESNCAWAWSGKFVLWFRKEFFHSWEFPMSHTGFCMLLS